MRTLVIAGEYPWPANSGSRLRLATVLRGLARCGPVELFSILPERRTDVDPPAVGAGVVRVGRVAYDDRPPTGPALLATAAHLGKPFELPRPDGGSALQALTRFTRGQYDLAWYFGMRPLLLTGRLLAATSVLDMVDLEDQKIAARLAIPATTPGGPAARVRGRVARAFSNEEIRRWRRIQRTAAGRMDATVVCSDLDAERARRTGMPRIEVVPNGYPTVDRPVGRTAVGHPPTVLFQGTLRYPPNAEAARFLVDAIAPRLRGLVPDARVRLVGTTAPGTDRLADPPRVTVVGQVPDMADELARADLVVVPLRFGSGTRLKILEAFAQRVPVVSTTLGAEGLGAEDDVHLLLADTAGGLAGACARLLGDEGLRGRLVDRAHQLFLERFADDVVTGEVAALARRVVGPSASS